LCSPKRKSVRKFLEDVRIIDNSAKKPYFNEFEAIELNKRELQDYNDYFKEMDDEFVEIPLSKNNTDTIRKVIKSKDSFKLDDEYALVKATSGEINLNRENCKSRANSILRALENNVVFRRKITSFDA
jgi:hypothetical protein